MKNWLRHRLHNFLFPQDEHAAKMAIAGSVSVRESNDAEVEGMRFVVMPAEGGVIVQMRTYDRRKDESNTKTYIIPEAEQDVAHKIGQIVAMELFKL